MSSAMARRFRAFSAVSLAGAAVLVFHTAAFAQQGAAKKGEAAKGDTKGAKEVKEVKSPPATAPEAATASKAETKPAETTPAETTPADANPADASPAEPQQELPPGYAPPPGYRYAPPPGPPRYPQPPSEGPYNQGPYYQPYYHDQYWGPPPPPAYPPPRYYRPYAPPPPVHYYPEPQRYRRFFIGFGLGVSGLAVFPDASDADNASRVGLGYDFRLGFGVSPRWSVVLSADGAAAYFGNVDVTSTVVAIGPQAFITHNLYARVGIGGAGRTYDYRSHDSRDRAGYYYDTESDSGMGGVAAIGMEFMQSYHLALGLEANGTFAYFPNHDVLSTFGINFMMNLF
jgi:hypothetical protein